MTDLNKIDFQSKLRRWLEIADTYKLSGSYKCPPIDLVLQSWGCTLPPILFWPFSVAAIVMGLYFGLTWAVLAHYFLRPRPVFVPAALAGALFGVHTAWGYGTTRRKHSLPSWEEIGKMVKAKQS